MCVFVFTGNTLCAQTDSLTHKATTIFDDLPVDDPAARSVLAVDELPQQKIEENIFVKTVVNKKQCYVGEPLLLVYELYTCLQSASTLVTKPVLPGFIAHPIQVNNEEIKYKQHNGKRYRLYRMLQYQVIPYQVGMLVIDAVSVKNVISYVDAGGNKKQYEGIVAGRETGIAVDVLPEANKPSSYSGAVGHFTVSSSLYASSSVAGEQNALSVVIEGVGNLSGVDLPDIIWPAEVEHFPAKEKTDIDYSSFPAAGKKIFEIPFVFKKTGSFTIPGIVFSFFDPSKKQYEITQCQPLSVLITPEAVINKEHPHENKRLHPLLYFLFVLIAFGIIILMIFLRKSKQLRTSQIVEQEDNASQEINIVEALAFIEHSNPGKDGIAQVKQLLLNYHNDKAATINAWKPAPEERDIKSTSAVTDLKELIDECNRLLYAPAVADDMVYKKFIKDCSSWMSRMTMHPA